MMTVPDSKMCLPLLVLLLAVLAGCGSAAPVSRQFDASQLGVLPVGPVTTRSGVSKVITENDLNKDPNLAATLGIDTIIVTLAHPDFSAAGLGRLRGQTGFPIQVPVEGDYSFRFDDQDGNRHYMRLLSPSGAEVYRVTAGEPETSVHLKPGLYTLHLHHSGTGDRQRLIPVFIRPVAAARTQARPGFAAQDLQHLHQLITTGSCAGCDLSNAFLNNGDLNGANLIGANLTNASFEGTGLAYADLTGANLTGIDLTNTSMGFAKLAGDTMAGANLSGANLYGANLNGANLSNANLSGADLNVATLTGANLSTATFSGATLNGANLVNATLTGANLTNAIFVHTNLTGADASRSNFTGSHLDGSNLANANLTGATWTDGTIACQDPALITSLGFVCK